MTLSQFREHMDHLVGCVNFTYNGHSCGVDPFDRNNYDVWYGDDCVTVHSVEDILTVKIFDGKTLSEVWDDITECDY